MSTPLSQISVAAFADEESCVNNLLPHTEVFQQRAAEIFTRASHYVENIRKETTETGVEGFIHQFGLDNHEGIAIMCLAEALLRIPDSSTANALIHDKLKDTEWEKYLSNDNSIFVNASTWGLMLTGGIINLQDSYSGGIKKLLGKLVARLGEPIIREALKKAMGILGTQFVIGNNIDSALKKAARLEEKGYLLSYDMLGEGARSAAQSDAFFNNYLNAIKAIGKSSAENALFKRPSISIKLSALHPRYELLQYERLSKELMPRLKELFIAARDNNLSVSIDAEEARRLDLSLLIYQKFISDKEFADFDGIGFVLQGYQKRAMPVLEFLINLAKTHGKKIPLRLVKGAYWDSEIKYAQEQGLDNYPVFTRKSHTDVSYLACAAKILEHPQFFYPQFATHNALTVASILEVAEGNTFEFQRLYGMGENFYDQLVQNRPCRIYAPVGRYDELLPYLIRRLLENGANTSFVNLLVDENEPIGNLLKSPINKAIKNKGLNPDIQLPENIHKDRKNSAGFDMGNYHQMNLLSDAIAGFFKEKWQAVPIIDGKDCTIFPYDRGFKIYSPYARDASKTKEVGTVFYAKKNQVEKALQSAKAAFNEWSNTTIDYRAKILDQAADLLEKNRYEAIALCIREAGKTAKDAMAEIREAVDFCRYYAQSARKFLNNPEKLSGITGETNTLSLKGRGVFVCISPWNFPLAIFTGQVTAALVAGNTVIAKPAEQTSLMAYFMVKLLHKAGIPGNVLHLLPGIGSKLGNMLTKDSRIAGVAFTGSTETAQQINLALAKRRDAPIATLIAETGGQNAMIVDSTALLEQAIDDVIASSFGSSGQRCSALRVLYLQDDIADKFIDLLIGAMQELSIGDPSDFSTDIGPVIDWKAQLTITAHIEKMKRKAKLIAIAPSYKNNTDGYFIAPHAFEIKSITKLKREIFGPILHIIRFKITALDKVIEEINSTGYGLTFGIHSRIEERVKELSQKIRAGNIYANRSIIGATVGAQPFGGMGLSGTGPKAGGPHYLRAFTTEQTVTINTTAIGGNLELIA